MPVNCSARSARLRQADRDVIPWPITGLAPGAGNAVSVELERDGIWWPLTIGDGFAEAPVRLAPGPSATVRCRCRWSVCRIRVTLTSGDESVSVTFDDAGWIELQP